MKRLRVNGSRRGSSSDEAFFWLRDLAIEAVRSCDAASAVERFCRIRPERLVIGERAVSLRGGGRIVLAAFGKAAAAMTEGIGRRIVEAGGKRPVHGLIVGPRDRSRVPVAGKRIRIRQLSGDHPIPLRASFRAGREMLGFLSRVRSTDDTIFLASGGGSALMAAPLAPFVGTTEKSNLHRHLVVSGAPIGSINAVRKHLSAVKGGRLAAAARRAKSQTTLIVCDVDPERFDEVASGPSLPDPTTIEDMVSVIDRYGLPTILPHKILDGLRRGSVKETPKPRDPIFRHSRAHVVLSNRDLRSAAVRIGLMNGLPGEAMPGDLGGPVETGVEIVARAIEAAPPGTRLLVMGGEVVTAPGGPGRGGRAQEFALRLAVRMGHLSVRPWAFVAIGSDGIDGNSPAAGAFVDGTTLERARRLKRDPGAALERADTYRFFGALGDEIVTEATGTNVRDLYLLLTGDPGEIRVRREAARRAPLPPESES